MQLASRDHLIHQTPALHGGGVVEAAEVPDLPCTLLAEDAGQVGGTEAGVEGADPGSRLAEAGVIRGDGDVAEHVEHVPAPHRDSVHGGDHRLGNFADHPVEGLDLEESGLAGSVVSGLLALLLVAAGAEGPIPGPGQAQHADLAISPGRLEGPDQLVDGPAAERVHALGPVDGDPRQSPIHLVTNVAQILNLHGSLPPRRSSRPRPRWHR